MKGKHLFLLIISILCTYSLYLTLTIEQPEEIPLYAIIFSSVTIVTTTVIICGIVFTLFWYVFVTYWDKPLRKMSIKEYLITFI